jgi:hypothetical protein
MRVHVNIVATGWVLSTPKDPWTEEREWNRIAPLTFPVLSVLSEQYLVEKYAGSS